MEQTGYETRNGLKSWATVGLHVLLWLIFFLLPYIFTSNMDRGHHPENPERRAFLYLTTVLNCFWVILFYFNAGILTPRLIYRKKIGFYLLAVIGILGLVVALDALCFRIFIHGHPFSIRNSIAHNFIPFIFMLAVSAAYKAISDKTKTDLLMRERESENLKTELSFLRSQVSPHFLFNVLNNIVAMVRLKSNELEPTVLKLSSLMQYMLYETDEEKVVIKSEVEYLHNYIDLQKQRFGEELTLRVDFDVQEEWLTVEPMLLIPFVENAFKHGNGVAGHPDIEIRLKVVNHELHFTVKNRFEASPGAKDKTSGIGLQNVKRRLELLYPHTHQLTIDQNGGWFTIHLDLKLQ